MATVNTRATTQWNPFWERGLGPIDVLGRIVLFATSALRAMPRSLQSRSDCTASSAAKG